METKEIINFLNTNDVYSDKFMSEDDYGDIFWDDEKAKEYLLSHWFSEEDSRKAISILNDWLDEDKEERDSWESEFESLTWYSSAADFYWVECDV